MKIMFVWRKMDKVAGGVERMLTTIMNALVQRGYDISLLTWDHKDATTYYEMDTAIKWHCLDMGDPMVKAGWGLRLKRIPKFREIIKKDNPDIIICFESGVFLTTRLFLTGFKTPIVAAERNAPSRLDFIAAKKKNRILRTLQMADKIIVQFERYIDEYPKYLRHKITYIHNPVKKASAQASPAGENGQEKVLLCVARLAYQKNIDVLIQAFALIKDDFPDWTLKIAGDGEDEAKITSLIKRLNLQDHVLLLGKVKNVEELYKQSHLFCLTSRWEGFPNAIAEAMAHGLPCVGFESCSGVRDLIQHEKTGVLAKGIDNAGTLGTALKELMKDGSKRQKMGKNALLEIKKYEPQAVYDQWENFFKNLTHNK